MACLIMFLVLYLNVILALISFFYFINIIFYYLTDILSVQRGFLFLMSGFTKFIKTKIFTPVAPFELAITALGVFLGIGTTTFLSIYMGFNLLIASFAASAVLLYAVPHLPLAQPRNCIGGHFIAATVGTIFYMALGYHWWVMTLAVATAIICMMLTGTVHPPAGATALIAVMTKATPMFILCPVFIGSLILVASAIISNNLSPNRTYPAKKK